MEEEFWERLSVMSAEIRDVKGDFSEETIAPLMEVVVKELSL